MPFDNEAAKCGLIQLLRGSPRAVLLVGAGSSIPVGYPSWPQLLEELRLEVIPELAQFPEMDLLSRAELIRTTLRSYPDHVDRRRQYEQLLSARFGPRTPSHAPFHRTLVQLPFCGFVTTNYDPTIESAATYVQVSARRRNLFKNIDAFVILENAFDRRYRAINIGAYTNSEELIGSPQNPRRITIGIDLGVK